MNEREESRDEHELAYALQEMQMEVNVVTMQLTTTIAGNNEAAKRILEGNKEVLDEWIDRTEKSYTKGDGEWTSLSNDVVVAIAEYAVKKAKEGEDKEWPEDYDDGPHYEI